MNKVTNQISIPTDTTVAIETRTYQYGVGKSVASPVITGIGIEAPDLALRLRFAFGEIFGFLFVLFTTAYIFIIPTAISKPVLLGAMVNRTAKRTVDIFGAIVGLLLCIPFWILIPIAIKLESSGPVFYSQTRVGINRRKRDRRCFPQALKDENRARERRRDDNQGKLFEVMKFRTMVQDAEKVSGPVWASKNDPRITRIGKFLRKTRLDEIPQFMNVLKGDMSLVGPRPERPSFVSDLSGKVDGYVRRLDVKPGLTGLAQVENGYDSSIASVARKVKTDIRYIDEWSLWNDFKIMARTVIVVFTGKGAC
jgi:lipopolysaccharide/colanic/teichoic acid biosynthesis glycosyltransferase